VDRALLVARGLTVVRDGTRIVDAADVTLPAATMLTIQGGSGSGKSTLLRALATLIPIASGQLVFDGKDVATIAVGEYRRRVAYVPQLPRMFDGTVADNLRTGPRFHGASLSDAAVGALVERVGLAASFANRVAGELSGGERLRVALARALANEPRVLLVDEPTSALDPTAAGVIIDLLRELGGSGTAVLTVTHSEDHAVRRSELEVEGTVVRRDHAWSRQSLSLTPPAGWNGRLSYKVRVYDYAGHSAEQTRAVWVDSVAPTGTIDAPLEGTLVRGGPVDVVFTATADDVERVKANDTPLTRIGERRWTGQVPLIGDNKIYFNVFDRANYGSYELRENNPDFGKPAASTNLSYAPRTLQMGFRFGF